jgi:hypothetical protein
VTIISQFGFCRLGAVRLVLVLGVLAVGLGLLPAAQSYPIHRAKAATLPAWQIKGAVKLKASDIKKVEKITQKGVFVQCGLIAGKRWVSGTIIATGISKGWFLALATEAKNLKAKSISLKKTGKAKQAKALLSLSSNKKELSSKGNGTCSSLNVAGGSGSGSGSANGSAAPLRFNFSGAVGVTVGSAASRKGRPSTRQSSGGIKAILANGALRDAITSGTATISKVAVSPSDQIVIAFQGKVNLDDASSSWSSTGCMIVTVDRSTGVPTCIDSSLTYLSDMGNNSESIQFDSSGGIYYVGSVGATSVLRRYKDGAVADLINSQINIYEFLVTGNGTVFVSGVTTATNTWFIRRYSANGTLKNLPGAGQFGLISTPFMQFPDGNVYMNAGVSSPQVARYLVGADAWDPTMWIGPGDGSGTNSWGTVCGSSCLWPQNYTIRAQTANGDMFVTGPEVIHRLYPSLAMTSIDLATTTVMSSAGNLVLMAGVNASNQNILVRFDSTTNIPTTIYSPSSSGGEIEFYHIEPTANGYALFDGLRFDNNTYVIGKIDQNTGAVSILSTITGKLDDFRSF